MRGESWLNVWCSGLRLLMAAGAPFWCGRMANGDGVAKEGIFLCLVVGQTNFLRVVSMSSGFSILVTFAHGSRPNPILELMAIAVAFVLSFGASPATTATMHGGSFLRGLKGPCVADA